MALTNCYACGGTTQIGAPWAPDSCPECKDQPVVRIATNDDNPWEVK